MAILTQEEFFMNLKSESKLFKNVCFPLSSNVFVDEGVGGVETKLMIESSAFIC